MPILYSQTTQNTSLAQNQRQLRAWPFVATGTGLANTAKLWVNTSGKTFRVELWSDNGGNASTMRPVNLLASQQATASATGQLTVTFSSPASLVSGTRYWMSLVTQETGNWAGANSAVSPLRVTGNTLTNFSDSSPNPWVTTTAGATAGDPYLIIESTEVSIASIDNLVSGETATVTMTDAGFAATQINLTSGGVTKTAALTATGTPAQFSFTVPQPADLETMLLVGTVAATVTNGTVTTAATNTSYAIKSGHPDDATRVNFTTTTYTSIATGNIGDLFGFDPPLKIGGQCSYDPTRGIAYADGTQDFYDYTGETRYIYRDPDTGVCNFWDVETINGTPVTPSDDNGLTSIGLTSTGLTSTGLIARGL